MKKIISRRLASIVFMGALSWGLISCNKNQNDKIDQKNVSENSLLATCAPIPDSLQVPSGNKFISEAFARGVQIYEVKRSAADPNTFEWVNIAPFATLYERPDFTKPVINHFAGPTWEFIKGRDKGESVVAKKIKGATIESSAIQWLLLEAVDDLSSPGNRVTFVQRICTEGGLAPDIIPTEANLGQLDSIPYHARYRFYEKE